MAKEWKAREDAGDYYDVDAAAAFMKTPGMTCLRPWEE